MTRTTIVILSVLATSSLAFSATVQKAAAQSGSTESQQPKVLATIKNGNTEIVFESPDNSDIPMNLFHMWDEFAGLYPDIERELSNQPSLLKSKGYLRKHAELREFLAAHQKLYQAMLEDPGNFFAPVHEARN